ncbi:MAG TPA: hypothetical protein VFO06_01005 [Gemmatimonadales bacterium]|nr:hypothetical protein [Gemmatimonadales bacterium]
MKLWRVLVLAVLTAPAPLAMAQHTIRIRIENEYLAYLKLGSFLDARRKGTDIVEGTLTLQPDGVTWKGEVEATVKFSQEIKGAGGACPMTPYRGSQRLQVTARPASGFNPGSQTITSSSGLVTGGFLALEVEPIGTPRMDPNDECLDMFGNSERGARLLPLNDARWIQPDAGYVIGLPQSGVLEYQDRTVETARDIQSAGNSPFESNSTWRIRVERL